MRMFISLLIPLVLGIMPAASMAKEPIKIRHYQFQERYAYGAQLLDLAMSKLGVSYEIVAPEQQSMNEARGELQVIEGFLDLQWMTTNTAREAKMIPVRIPIYRGVLGLRLLLVQKERHVELSKIRNLDDLRGYTGGHGLHWGDLPVYGANELKVSAHIKYESLFKLLKLGRFDYFHRGVNEIWAELERHQDGLAIADNVMLFYPLPVYFFVSDKRPELASMIEKGLTMALEDGSFKEQFMAYHGQFLKNAKLDQRVLVPLKNPDLPPVTPEIDTSWWMERTVKVPADAL